MPHFNDNDTIDASETMETVRLQPPKTPTQDDSDSDTENIEGHINELDSSTPHIDKFQTKILKALDELHMDESFSLPKVNGNSLVGLLDKNDNNSISKDNILDEI